jgi:hypothetical protein
VCVCVCVCGERERERVTKTVNYTDQLNCLYLSHKMETNAVKLFSAYE